jgi:hypothetical protein
MDGGLWKEGERGSEIGVELSVLFSTCIGVHSRIRFGGLALSFSTCLACLALCYRVWCASIILYHSTLYFVHLLLVFTSLIGFETGVMGETACNSHRLLVCIRSSTSRLCYGRCY